MVRDGDLAAIAAPIDVLGVNYYHGNEVSGHPRTDVVGIGADHPDRVALSPFVGSEHVTFPSRGLPVTAMGWEIQPDGLHRLLRRLHDDYPRLPIHLTETGAAFDDRVDEHGDVHDPDRIAFLDSYLRAVHRAIEEGVDVRGFFQWSFMRQLRVGLRLRQALRARARRLRHPAAHAQVERALVRRAGADRHPALVRAPGPLAWRA